MSDANPEISFKEFDDAIAKTANGKYVLTVSSIKKTMITLSCGNDLSYADARYTALKSLYTGNEKVHFEDSPNYRISFVLGDAGPELPVNVTTSQGEVLEYWTTGDDSTHYTSIPSSLTSNTEFVPHWKKYAYVKIKIPEGITDDDIQPFRVEESGGVATINNEWSIKAMSLQATTEYAYITIQIPYVEETEKYRLPEYLYVKYNRSLYRISDSTEHLISALKTDYENGTSINASTVAITRIGICSESPFQENNPKDFDTASASASKYYYVISENAYLYDNTREAQQNQTIFECNVSNNEIISYIAGNIGVMYKKNGVSYDEYPYWDAAYYRESDKAIITSVKDIKDGSITGNQDGIQTILLMYPKYVTDDAAVTVTEEDSTYSVTISADVSFDFAFKLNSTQISVEGEGDPICAVDNYASTEMLLIYNPKETGSPLEITASNFGSYANIPINANGMMVKLSTNATGAKLLIYKK